MKSISNLQVCLPILSSSPARSCQKVWIHDVDDDNDNEDDVGDGDDDDDVGDDDDDDVCSIAAGSANQAPIDLR